MIDIHNYKSRAFSGHHTIAIQPVAQFLGSKGKKYHHTFLIEELIYYRMLHI
jgi:hypothetical protein